MTREIKRSHVRAVARAGPRLRAVALAVLTSAVLAGCDKGVNHKPVKDLVYFFDVGSTSIYMLDADSLTLIDSIPNVGYWSGASEIEYMVVTPDGRWLFTSDAGNAKGTLVRKINTVTKQTVDSVYASHRGALLLLDKGRLLRWGSCDGWLTEVDKFPVVTVDTTAVCIQHGPISGTTIAGGVTETNHIRVETVLPRATIAEFVATKIDSVPMSEVYYVALHPDGKRVSAIARGGGYFFIVANIATGQTIYQHAFTSQAGQFSPGEIAINSTGTLAIITDPGKPWFGMHVGTIDVVDLVNLRLLKRFDQDDFDGPQSNSQIAFTSDEKAVIVTTIANWGFSYIHRLDLETLTITKTAWFEEVAVGGMTVGRSPQQ